MIFHIGFEESKGYLNECWACKSCIMPRNFHNYVQGYLVHFRVYVFDIIHKECEKYFPGIEDLAIL